MQAYINYVISFLTGAQCIPTGGSGLTHLVVSDNVEHDIPVTSSRVMVVKQQVCLLTIIIMCVHRCVCMHVNLYKHLHPHLHLAVVSLTMYMKSASLCVAHVCNILT